MLAVTMIHSFNHEVVITLFDTEEEARDYHKWLFEAYLQEEKEQGSELNKEQCLYSADEGYAKVTWNDNCTTEFVISNTYEPFDGYERRRK